MKQKGLWAAGVVLLVVGVVAVLAVGTGFAKDENAGAKCSEATLRGTYLFAYDGVVIEGNAQEGNAQVPKFSEVFAVAGYQVFNGNGNGRGVSSFSVNGEITRKEPYTSTYIVKADCTATQVVEAGITTHYDLFIAPDGSMYTFVQTDPGTVASGSNFRATAKRVAQ